MTGHLNLSWALRPDPVLGTKVVAVWSVGPITADAEPTAALEIDLMGHAQITLNQARRDWIAINDDVPSHPVDSDEAFALLDRVA